MVFDVTDSLLAFDLVVQILVQFGVAFFSYKVYTFNRSRKALLLVPTAFVIMGLRRILAMLIVFEHWPIPEDTLRFVDRLILPAIVSVFLAIGFIGMLKQFESFEMVGRKAEAKSKKFSEAMAKNQAGRGKPAK